MSNGIRFARSAREVGISSQIADAKRALQLSVTPACCWKAAHGSYAAWHSSCPLVGGGSGANEGRSQLVTSFGAGRSWTTPSSRRHDQRAGIVRVRANTAQRRYQCDQGRGISRRRFATLPDACGAAFAGTIGIGEQRRNRFGGVSSGCLLGCRFSGCLAAIHTAQRLGSVHANNASAEARIPAATWSWRRWRWWRQQATARAIRRESDRTRSAHRSGGQECRRATTNTRRVVAAATSAP